MVCSVWIHIGKPNDHTTKTITDFPIRIHCVWAGSVTIIKLKSLSTHSFSINNSEIMKNKIYSLRSLRFYQNLHRLDCSAHGINDF